MIPKTLSKQIADLYFRVAEVERRGRNRKRTGTIAEVGTGDNAGKYRVQLSKPNGKPFLSPWMKARTVGAGGVKIDVVRTVGEQVDVISESGELTDAVIDMSTYSDANSRENAENVPMHIKIDGDGVIICSSLTISANVTINGDVAIVGSGLTHNGRNVGSTHTHPESIGTVTGAPQ